MIATSVSSKLKSMTQKNYIGENLKHEVRKKKADSALKEGLKGLFSKKKDDPAVVVQPEFDEL